MWEFYLRRALRGSVFFGGTTSGTLTFPSILLEIHKNAIIEIRYIFPSTPPNIEFYCVCTNSAGSTQSTSSFMSISAAPGSIVAYRPTSGNGATALPNAIDTTGISIDNTTSSNATSAKTVKTYTFTGFTSDGTVASGKINLRLSGTTVYSEYVPRPGDTITETLSASSSIDITYSYNSGPNISLFHSDSGMGDPSSLSILASETLSGVILNTLSITITIAADSYTVYNEGDYNPVTTWVNAAISLFDVAFITE